MTKSADAIQLTLGLLDDPRDPLTCPYRHESGLPGHSICTLKEENVWVTCGEPQCGEINRCAYEKQDNSPQAMARRRQWMESHKPRKTKIKGENNE